MVEIAEKSNAAGPRSILLTVRLLATWARAAHGQPLVLIIRRRCPLRARRNCLLIGCCIYVVIGSFSQLRFAYSSLNSHFRTFAPAPVSFEGTAQQPFGFATPFSVEIDDARLSHAFA